MPASGGQRKAVAYPGLSPLTLSLPPRRQSLPLTPAAVSLKKAPSGEIMVNSILTPSATEAARIELKSYNTAIPMGSLAIGVDNIPHDAVLSPRLVPTPRAHSFDLIPPH